jgi:hypothetical protein
MDEREAARDSGLLARKASRPSPEMAGAGFGYRGDDSPLVAVFEAASKAFSSFGNILYRTLANQHAVSIAVKAVARFDGVMVGAQHIFASSECTD